MSEPTDTITPAAPSDITATNTAESAIGTELVEDELLVEEISIDGMCGVY